MKSFQFLTAVFLGSILLQGCGSETEPATSIEETTAAPESTLSGRRPTAGTPIGGRARSLEGLMWHFAGMDTVEWVRFEDENVYIGVAAPEGENYQAQIFKDALEAHSKLQEDFTLWFIDGRSTKDDWAPGDEGLLSKMKVPIKLDLKMPSSDEQ